MEGNNLRGDGIAPSHTTDDNCLLKGLELCIAVRRALQQFSGLFKSVGGGGFGRKAVGCSDHRPEQLLVAAVRGELLHGSGVHCLEQFDVLPPFLRAGGLQVHHRGDVVARSVDVASDTGRRYDCGGLSKIAEALDA